MLAVRIIGILGLTSEIRAENHPVSASAASTITNVTGALDGPGSRTIASQGSRAPPAKAALTASASRSGAAREADVMPCSASAWAASASCAVNCTATCRARSAERPRETYSPVSSSSSASGAVSSCTRSAASWAACRSCSARSLEYSTVPIASVPATSPAKPANASTLELTPAPANPSQIPADVRMPSLASGTRGRIRPKTLVAAFSRLASRSRRRRRCVHRPARISSPVRSYLLTQIQPGGTAPPARQARRVRHRAGDRVVRDARLRAARFSRRVGREDEESGDLLVGVERHPGLHVAGLVAQRDVDHGVIADAPDERLGLGEALERADKAGDRGQRAAPRLVGERRPDLVVERRPGLVHAAL